MHEAVELIKIISFNGEHSSQGSENLKSPQVNSPPPRENVLQVAVTNSACTNSFQIIFPAAETKRHSWSLQIFDEWAKLSLV
jgi:hypothetical protein